MLPRLRHNTPLLLFYPFIITQRFATVKRFYLTDVFFSFFFPAAAFLLNSFSSARVKQCRYSNNASARCFDKLNMTEAPCHSERSRGISWKRSLLLPRGEVLLLFKYYSARVKQCRYSNNASARCFDGASLAQHDRKLYGSILLINLFARFLFVWATGGRPLPSINKTLLFRKKHANPTKRTFPIDFNPALMYN